MAEFSAAHLAHPLQVTRLRSARSTLASQLPDEARYHPRETLTLLPPRSVMTPAMPLVGLGGGPGRRSAEGGAAPARAGLSTAVVTF